MDKVERKENTENIEPILDEKEIQFINLADAIEMSKQYELYTDNAIKRFVLTLIGSPLADNNYRKMHGMPMWRK